jgi:Reverse transcriptase (RNA-dependent DNA polymerase)
VGGQREIERERPHDNPASKRGGSVHRPFDIEYVRYLMTPKDVYQFSLGRTAAELETRLSAACVTLSDASYLPTLRTTPKVKGEWVFVPDSFEDKLFIRHLNDRLSKAYRVRFTHRDDIVRQITALMRADAKLRIIRSDIRRFFRSIHFEHLIEQFRLDGKLSSHEICTLSAIAARGRAIHHTGLLWGLSISSTLAEIYSRPFDHQLRSLDGVYYYSRFVDDVIIFASRPNADVLDEIKGIAAAQPGRMKLSEKKTECIDETDPAHTLTKFCYLGYEFSRPLPPKTGEGIPTIRMAEKKIIRIKDRLMRTFRQFVRDRSWEDLRDRLKLLTGNYTITRTNHLSVARTGIYYNYQAATDRTQLHDLDAFLRNLVFGLRCKKRRTLHPIRKHELNRLLTFSFHHGADKKIMHRFTRRRLQHLFRAWRHED